MVDPVARNVASKPDDPRAILARVDAVLVPFHADRLAALGPDASGLYEHYQALVESGSLFRQSELDRLVYVLKWLPPYRRYVVYRAGLGELAFALAAAGRRVTAWEPNNARRAAIEAGYARLSKHSAAVRDNFTLAGASPDTIVLDAAETSLGLAFDLVIGGEGEAQTARAVLGTHALLYEPRLLLRTRDPGTADAEARDLLAGAGFDAFRPAPLTGLALARRGPLQPKAQPLAFAPRARSRAAPKGACKGLFAVVGSSYCGSTLLNAMLGSHPQVAGAGELHWLMRDSPRSVCALCGDACPVWPRRVRRSVTHESVYDVTAAAFGRPFVCDATKMPDWFKAVLPLHDGLPQASVLIVKHPVRHVASFLHKAAYREDLAVYRDPDYVLRSLIGLYNLALGALSLDLLVRYEDLVADPRGVVSKVLALHGLEYDGQIERWQSRPHHFIGGNGGMRVMLDRSIRPGTDHLRRKYDRDGVFLDNSYLEVLDEKTFAEISESPFTTDLCDMFGYRPLPWKSARGA